VTPGTTPTWPESGDARPGDPPIEETKGFRSGAGGSGLDHDPHAGPAGSTPPSA
jgi:hypothetical protein